MHTLFKPFAIGTLMLSVTAYQAASGAVTVADFAGKWGGEWSGGGIWSTLTVTDVEPLEIRYCYADSCGSGSKELDNVRFEEDELRFKWGKGKFRFSLDGETLEGTYVNSRGKTYTVEMTRRSITQVSAVTVAGFTGKWGGEWSGGGLWSTLTITDAEPLEIGYCYGGSCGSGTKDLDNVRFEEDELRFKWGKGKFRFSLDGETLEGTYVNSRGKTYTVEMTRRSTTQASDVTVADFAGKWTGRWSGGGSRSTLTITDAEPPKVKYCYGGNCRSKSLKNVRFDEGYLWFNWGRRAFQFSLDGETLEGISGSHDIRMTRK